MRGLNLFLAFDFFGAGNIGDDLMMAGFLRGLRELSGVPGRMLAVCARDLESQQRRFPDLHWFSPAEAWQHWESHDPSTWAWVGVGGTPFQVLSGPWMTQFLVEQSAIWPKFARRVMIGVGAEREAGDDAETLAPLARQMDLIVTRDAETAHLLREKFDCWPDRVFEGADLAHLAWPGQGARHDLTRVSIAARRFELGVIAASYMLVRHEVEAIGEYLAHRSSASEPIAWLANDIRIQPGMERHALLLLSDRFGSEWRERVNLRVPPYEDGTLAELLEPIGACERVLSSRYHGLLAAAWLGARVAGFGGASKVGSLARDFGVPMLDRPISAEGLSTLEREAIQVPADRLAALRSRALAGLEAALD